MPDATPAFQYADMQQEESAARLGMWVFLSTEVLFFGGLMLLYLAYRYGYPNAFAAAAKHTQIVIGTLNTAILLTSSFAVAWAVTAAREGAEKIVAVLFAIAALLGCAFIALKGIEYFREYKEHLIPAVNFHWAEAEPGAAEIFWIFYFVATGLHALHLTIGVTILFVMSWRAAHGAFSAEYHTPLTVTALYWHFVDLVWIFLFALIYLPGRNTP